MFPLGEWNQRTEAPDVEAQIVAPPSAAAKASISRPATNRDCIREVLVAPAGCPRPPGRQIDTNPVQVGHRFLGTLIAGGGWNSPPPGSVELVPPQSNAT